MRIDLPRITKSCSSFFWIHDLVSSSCPVPALLDLEYASPASRSRQILGLDVWDVVDSCRQSAICSEEIGEEVNRQMEAIGASQLGTIGLTRLS